MLFVTIVTAILELNYRVIERFRDTKDVNGFCELVLAHHFILSLVHSIHSDRLVFLIYILIHALFCLCSVFLHISALSFSHWVFGADMESSIVKR